MTSCLAFEVTLSDALPGSITGSESNSTFHNVYRCVRASLLCSTTCALLRGFCSFVQRIRSQDPISRDTRSFGLSLSHFIVAISFSQFVVMVSLSQFIIMTSLSLSLSWIDLLVSGVLESICIPYPGNQGCCHLLLRRQSILLAQLVLQSIQFSGQNAWTRFTW